jgi:hypothetical protein
MSAWAEGLLGAVMGGTASAVHSIDEDEKARKLREEREAAKKDQLTLHEKKLEVEQRMKRQLEDLERGRVSEFYAKNKRPDQEIDGVEVDESGKEIGKIKGEGPADPMKDSDSERRWLEKAREAGDAGLIEKHSRALAAAEEAERRAADTEERAKDRDADRDERAKDRDQRNKDRDADRGAAERRHKESLDAAREAREGNWKVDDKGRYVKTDGSLVTRKIREGGKEIGEEYVYAQERNTRENPDQKQRREEYNILLRKNAHDRSPEEETRFKALQAEFSGSGGAGKSSKAPAERAPIGSFNRAE